MNSRILQIKARLMDDLLGAVERDSGERLLQRLEERRRPKPKTEEPTESAEPTES